MGSQAQQGSAANVGYNVGVQAAAMAANYYIPGSGIAVQIAGQLLGSVLFPPQKQKVRGPRVEDLTVTSSTYGQRIPIVYGSMRLNTNIIWSSGLKEATDTNTTGGKGMGSAPSTQTVNYTYSADVAMGICEGPITNLLRIWMDQKLVYDATSNTATGLTPITGLKFKFYTGSEDQLPDPIMEDALGVGNVPAHRGLAYIMFEDLQLAKFGNRIPAVSVEVTREPVETNDIATVGTTSGATNSVMSVDWNSNLGYTVFYNGAPLDQNGISVFDLTTMQEVLARSTDSLVLDGPASNGGGIHAGATSEYVYIQGSASGMLGVTTSVGRFNKYTLTPAGRFDETDLPVQPVLPQLDDGFFNGAFLWEVPVIGDLGIEWYCVVQGYNGDMAVLDPSMAYVWSRDNPYGVTAGAGRGVTGTIELGIGQNSCYAFNDNGISSFSGIVNITKIKVAAGATFIPAVGMTPGESVGVTNEEYSIAVGSIDSTATLFTRISPPSFDSSDNTLIFMAETNGTGDQTFLVKWLDGVIKWVSPLQGSLPASGYGLQQSRLRRNIYAYGLEVTFGSPSGTFLLKYDTVTGEYLGAEGENGGDWESINLNWLQSYDSDTNSLVTNASGAGTNVARLYGGHIIGSEGTLLSEIVTDLCSRAGVESTEINVSQLTDTVRGFLVDGQTTIRTALEPLAAIFFFDPVESDGVIKFIKRGGSSVATIVEDDIGQRDDNDLGPVLETRVQEIELPERVTLTYIDRARDFQEGSQSQKRAREPLNTTNSRNAVNADVPVVMTASEAKSKAGLLLKNAWVERAVIGMKLPWKFLYLDASDSVTVVLNDGTVYRLRLNSIEIGMDFSMDVEAVTNGGTKYAAVQVGDSGQGFQQSVVTSSNPATKLFVMDLPLLLETHDTAGVGTNIYYALSGIGQTGWAGAVIYRSPDGSTYASEAWGAGGVAAPWGNLTEALPAVDDPWVTDETSVLKVSMVVENDILSSVSQTQMLNGANSAVVLNSSGEPELIQFRDVTINGGVFELRGLLRGRRGTDVYIGNHPAGSRFILLSSSWIGKVVAATSDIGATRFYKGVGVGARLEDVSPVSLNTTGRDLKPWAVVNIASTGNPGDVDITWNRRTRVNGEWVDGTGTVPLGEVTEEYEIDVRAVGSSTVLNTYTATSETYTYTAAQQTADFGTIPAACEIDIYQMSDTVGRGFKATATVPLL